MKTLLLCGAALCAVSAAFPAFAADESAVKLGLGGYFKGYASYVNQDGSGVRKTDFLRQTEVHFDGKSELPNGLTVGIHIEGQADGADDFFLDESYVFGSGSWGKVNFGRTYGAPYVLQVVAPSADSNIDGRLQLFTPINYAAAGISLGTSTETDYDQDVSAKYDKITYVTPLFSGFQAGISYTPESNGTSRGSNGNDADNHTTASSNIWEGAVRFENKVNETLSYVVGAGYTKAQVETGSNPDREAWNTGLSVKVGAVGLGAAYQSDDLGDAHDTAKYSVVGADYTVGSFVYGVNYYNKNDDVNSVDLKRYSVGVNYKMVPGIGFRGSVGYYDVNDADSSANATAVLIGTDIKF